MFLKIAALIVLFPVLWIVGIFIMAAFINIMMTSVGCILLPLILLIGAFLLVKKSQDCC
jgi:hypothetical protein